MVDLIQEAYQDGARIDKACQEAGIALRTYRRWFTNGTVQQDQRPLCSRPTPPHKLSPEERQNIIEVCNLPEYAHLPPTQIVPDLLDKGVYHASESSYYRILKEAKQVNRRGRSQAPTKRHKPSSYEATAANQVWSWDISYLPSQVNGLFFYLYLFVDIYSRKIVGYEVYDRECGTLASQLVQRSVLQEHCLREPLVLHADNGAPMKSFTLKATLEELGITHSYSRPRVSNDNPFSEALFKTLKYVPNWPSEGFNDLESARDWVQTFVTWYNHEHKHSQIKFVSPAERHEGLDAAILAQRQCVLEKAKAANPKRWSGSVRNCSPVESVTLNPDKPCFSDMKSIE